MMCVHLTEPPPPGEIFLTLRENDPRSDEEEDDVLKFRQITSTLTNR